MANLSNTDYRRKDEALTSSIRSTNIERPLAIVQYPESYVQPLIVDALRSLQDAPIDIVEDDTSLHDLNRPCVQFRAYEALDFEHAMEHSTKSLVCAYVIRKALIRKHYLSNTVETWMAKHPESSLQQHFKQSLHFELDYAEFLDDALVEAWDLHESMVRNEQAAGKDRKEWWILKPGMSDGGNGIRLFSSLQELQSIFEEWDPPSEDEEEEEGGEGEGDDIYTNDYIASEAFRIKDNDQALLTSQLRHFVVQPYIDPPLLLKSYQNRKFHVRCYVLAVGALKVFVYKEMLALFAAKTYESSLRNESVDEIDLSQHLTNTCFQDESTKESSVHQFWDLRDPEFGLDRQTDVFTQICEVVGDVFEAAAREQMIHFQAIPNAFEIFGVDFLVDAQCNVWLLETNAYPDFKQTGEGLQKKIVGGLFEEVVKIAVAPFFKTTSEAQPSERMVLVRDVALGRG